MKILTLVLIVIIGMVVFAFWKNLRTPTNLGVTNNKLADCPNTPNCVSSFATDKEHAIDPIQFNEKNPLLKLKSIILENFDVQIQQESQNYMHVIFISKKMRYRDDVEFLVDDKNHLINVRSASRIGYGDMGANRARIEKIRRLF